MNAVIFVIFDWYFTVEMLWINADSQIIDGQNSILDCEWLLNLAKL